MRGPWSSLWNARNPLWRLAGVGMVAATFGITARYVMRGPRPIEPRGGGEIFAGEGGRGRLGTITELMGPGRFILNYETLLGSTENLELQGVTGRLEEPATLWLMTAPAALGKESVWTLNGPMALEARDLDHQVTGRGAIPEAGPALRWDHGTWRGLRTLVWDDLGGQGRGRWTLPSGWYRRLDGRFIVEKGPIHWESSDPGSTLRTLDGERMEVALGFSDGRLEGVRAHLQGGDIDAREADVSPGWVKWSPPMHFSRDDGWKGEARGGLAPRPRDGESMSQLELQGFKARKGTPDGDETLEAEGVRWTPAGLRLEGDVRWDQPADGLRLMLRAPRVLIREAPGPDLPANLPVGEAWAEGQALLSWGDRTLSSPRIEARRRNRTWRILAPALGRGEQGTFTAGEGKGSPARWEFAGPILANVLDGGTLRGSHLLWEGSVWTFTGHPATWTRLRERLSGPKLVRKGEKVLFPEGIHGALAASDGDMTLRADGGEAERSQVLLAGRVECRGQGWSLQADRISVTLGAGSTVKIIEAKGAVILRGRMGEGWGESLTLDPGGSRAKWEGRVRGSGEVTP